MEIIRVLLTIYFIVCFIAAAIEATVIIGTWGPTNDALRKALRKEEWFLLYYSPYRVRCIRYNPFIGAVEYGSINGYFRGDDVVIEKAKVIQIDVPRFVDEWLFDRYLHRNEQ